MLSPVSVVQAPTASTLVSACLRNSEPFLKRAIFGSYNKIYSLIPVTTTDPRRGILLPSMPARPTITVLYFAAASTAVGIAREAIELPDNNGTYELRLSALGHVLVEKHPATRLESVLATSAWSVNAEMVEDPDTVWLRGGDEVAVICPVSGG